MYMYIVINRSGYLEHDVAREILNFQCKTWEFRATSCSRHPGLFIGFIMLRFFYLDYISGNVCSDPRDDHVHVHGGKLKYHYCPCKHRHSLCWFGRSYLHETYYLYNFRHEIKPRHEQTCLLMSAIRYKITKVSEFQL